MYLVVFFLLVWALFSFCEGCFVPRPDNNHLYILHAKSSRNHLFIQKLNFYLQHDPKKLYPKPLDLYNCSSKLLNTMQNTNNLRYVINLRVTDFYQNNYNEVESNGYLYAGDISTEAKYKNKVCKLNFQNHNDTCEYVKTVLQKDVKLVSKEIRTIPFLYDLVYNFQNSRSQTNNNQQEDHIIFICPRTRIKEINKYNRTFNDAVKTFKYITDECDNMHKSYNKADQKNIIAVLAPNPNWIEETNKPVIFYEESFSIHSETASYPNSMTRVKSWKLLADSLIQLIRKMSWMRVAVLSDGSVESDDFEELLKDKFTNEGLAYQVTTVLETNQQYDFSKALESFKQDEVTIIIANLEPENVPLLARQANEYGMNNNNVLWIARTLSHKDAMAAARHLGVLLYMYQKQTFLREKYLNLINAVIEQKYLDTKNSYDFRNPTQFANDIRKEIKNLSDKPIIIQVMLAKANFYSSLVKYRHDKGEVSILNTNLTSLPKYKWGDCMFPSPNYNNPCNDMELIYLMMVITVAAVTVLGITVFFQTPDSPYHRM